MNERSVVSFSLRKLSRDNSYFTYFNSRLKTCLAYQASALLAKLFNIRYEDILINLTIILMSHESERNRYYRARSKLALGDIAQHGSSILVLVLAAQLLQDDVTFHHLSVLTFLALHGKSLALLHHSHNLSIHNYIMKKMFQDHRTISALSCFFDAAKVLRKPRQNNPFPTTSPKNPRFWEKSGISWEKVRRRRKRELKSKEKGKNLSLSPKKSLIFSQRWEKTWESWEKLPPQPTF